MEDVKTRSQSERWRDFFEVLLLALSLALFLRTFIFGFYRISTGNMAPNLRTGDFVWVSKTSYGFKVPFTSMRILEKLPEKGDLVLFRYPDQPDSVHIKRVVGLPGDHILIHNHKIEINDQLIELVPIESSKFSGIMGFEFMSFYRETNGSKSYEVMYTQGSSVAKDIGPLVVPPGEVFLIGDNRDASDDSRYWGSVPMTHIEAEMKGIWFSFEFFNADSEKQSKVRWDRIKLIL